MTTTKWIVYGLISLGFIVGLVLRARRKPKP
jgi:hypothetical protein